MLNQVCKLVLRFVCPLLVVTSASSIPVDCAHANSLSVEGKTYFIDKNFSFRSRVVFDTLPFKFTTKDSNSLVRNAITGSWMLSNQGITFSFSNSIILNYKKWNVSPGNQVYFSPFGIMVSDLSISNEAAQISIATRQNKMNNPIDISIENFNLGDLAGILNNEAALFSGLLNATITVSEMYKNLPAVTGTASINKLTLMEQAVGDLQVNAQKLDDQTVHTIFDLKGNGNNITAVGNYFLNDAIQQLNILLDIKRLQPSVMQGLFKNKISINSGYINGQVAVKGKWSQPEWKGNVNVDSVKLSIPGMGTTYSINQQKISFDYPAVNFTRFVLKDYQDDSIIVDGSVSSNSLKDYNLNLRLTSPDFIVINSPRANNSQLYGLAGTSAAINLTGTITHPVMKGNMDLNGKTDLNLVLPDKNIDKEEAGAVVRFIDRRKTGFSQTVLPARVVESSAQTTTTFSYNLNIGADSSASLNIILDPSTGDELRVKGKARLNASADSGKNQVLKGEYRLDSGYYELNYQFQKKRFNVIQGSAINFNGRPMEALMNIMAVYPASTSPQELLGNEVGSVDPAIAYSFKQQIPFNVVLSLKGSLSQPAISFDIQIKDGVIISSALRKTIENKLTQLRGDKAATNKQVFALLVMDRFVGEQSTDFFKGNGSSTGFSDIAKSSVSQFLSAALDEIASDLFKGINVDLNLNSYKDFIVNEGRQKNDLGVDVSKNFLNDRLSVTVGRTYGIESQDGSAKAAQQKGSRFLPDVTVNYKLSKDGKYMLRSYNKDQFEVILDGYVVETGLAFIVTMDYDKYTELFVTKNKKRGR